MFDSPYTWRWLARKLTLGALLLLSGSACNDASVNATLVGKYSIHGVLVENTCGQTGLPAANPLDFEVSVREDNGVGYWLPSKQAQNTGTLDASGNFRFSLSQTKVVSVSTANQNLQPSDFTTQQPDFDLQQKTCAVSIIETVTGTISKRNAADGGMVMDVTHGTAGTGGSANDTTPADLSADDTITVTPSAGSDCTQALSALGGTYDVLPCDAKYVLQGQLVTDGSAASP